MTLREMRTLFTKILALLVQKINSTPGYTVALNEVKRSDEQAAINALGESGRNYLSQHLQDIDGFHALALAVSNNGKGNGILMSVHRDGVAADILLYKDGVWCQDAKDYEQFGEWWEKQDELARWGGRFRDPAHFSLEWQGRK